MRALQNSLLVAILIFGFFSCETSTTIEPDDKQEKEEQETTDEKEQDGHVQKEEEKEMTAIEFAQYVADAIYYEGYNEWNDFADEKVYFSPYAYVDTTKIVSLTKSDFNQLFESEKKIIWGNFDGSGDEIKLSIQGYFDRFVNDFDLTDESNQILKDTIPTRGNELNNVKEIFPNSTIIEIHKPASEESMGMDWRSLMLVIKKVEGSWKLKALVHNEWTI